MSDACDRIGCSESEQQGAIQKSMVEQVYLLSIPTIDRTETETLAFDSLQTAKDYVEYFAGQLGKAVVWGEKYPTQTDEPAVWRFEIAEIGLRGCVFVDLIKTQEWIDKIKES